MVFIDVLALAADQLIKFDQQLMAATYPLNSYGNSQAFSNDCG